jgi:ABC-type antimicrobial peptide transport system ATPase subunit
MRCVVYSKCELPEFRGIRGPIMSPTELDPQLIMKWLYVGLDVREVMPDGSYRRLEFNDKKLNEMIDKEDMTMVIVTHEMGFAREVATKIIFMDEGVIKEEKPPKEFFANPENERLKDFLSKVL